MRLTTRDVRLLRDLSLSHVLSRDQLIALGYFSSVTRCNTRLRDLAALGLLRRLETPFFSQSLFAVCSKASEVVGERLAALTATRTGSPRFLQHALCTQNIRIALLKKGADEWRFEQQASCTFRVGSQDLEVRPDGLALQKGHPIAVEADLGHVAPSKVKAKLEAYQAFAESGESLAAWNSPVFTLLIVTTGELRAKRLSRLMPTPLGFTLIVKPADRLGIPFVGAWS